ncbi:hypothetical protein SAMN04488518_1258 [Pseudovibrio ascidiaceicola]|uniref:Uncharacterized protein n=1 Tax=Pseudovibrio ascidiaceicola TaxID=285279 RepID=A0A1I4FZW1_9HYPH|nr:hypothetical protein SAMN04488518_1258 [Pseudovibrio ascidiaceicola]
MHTEEYSFILDRRPQNLKWLGTLVLLNRWARTLLPLGLINDVLLEPNPQAQNSRTY